MFLKKFHTFTPVLRIADHEMLHPRSSHSLFADPPVAEERPSRRERAPSASSRSATRQVMLEASNPWPTTSSMTFFPADRKLDDGSTTEERKEASVPVAVPAPASASAPAPSLAVGTRDVVLP